MEFINSQNRKMRAKIDYELTMLKEFGKDLRMPHSEHLKDEIFQLRIQVANDISRILYFFYSGEEIILTNGFVKKTRTTPPKEIETAKKYYSDYLERMRKNGNF